MVDGGPLTGQAVGYKPAGGISKAKEALTYLVLMTFNVLIFRQWAYNEKLIPKVPTLDFI